MGKKKFVGAQNIMLAQGWGGGALPCVVLFDSRHSLATDSSDLRLEAPLQISEQLEICQTSRLVKETVHYKILRTWSYGNPSLSVAMSSSNNIDSTITLKCHEMGHLKRLPACFTAVLALISASSFVFLVQVSTLFSDEPFRHRECGQKSLHSKQETLQIGAAALKRHIWDVRIKNALKPTRSAQASKIFARSMTSSAHGG